MFLNVFISIVSAIHKSKLFCFALNAGTLLHKELNIALVRIRLKQTYTACGELAFDKKCLCRRSLSSRNQILEEAGE